ncbi:MAG: RNA polymerase-associated protein RapA [Thiohalocapsa sp.]|uniref:RNA polymerase-associated protein RapA n=1 Tax=Thiohalocapsa sp. TaxID=2497641 RepID=UPI0025DE355B|nr:RNA polymerase-associated protein RapA [Thiohalocapsa sp.]MCG6943472.1 RNA polymerase-associated protein RapA [Thiohalocapsa sp.]
MPAPTADPAPQDFKPGQRWLSETQAELGLGIVEASDERTVSMRFPATGEQRLYARRSAPLWRAVFGVGDVVRDIDGQTLTVVAVAEHANLLVYSGEDADGATQQVPEQLLAADLHLNRPQQKLLAARLDRDTWFRLRQHTWSHRGEWPLAPVHGLMGARIAPIPHQLYIAAEVADRLAPRVLLADEVGLGKTIEAGLILHRMLLDGRARRVLILVPEALLHQWLVELLRRFNLRFALFDRERINASAPDGHGNAFESEQRVLCSLDLLTETPSHAAAVLGADWDLLIVDEAHHLEWTPEDSGLDYDLVEALADQTPAVLLLTATPEQLGRMGHFGRLRLLDPERFSDYDAFLAEEADYAAVAEIAARLLEDVPLDDEQATRLHAALGDTTGLATDTVVERLLDRHGTSRILFRNTRAAVAGFPERHPHAHALVAPEGYVVAGADATHPERAAGATWPEHDPRVTWLLELLRELHPAKVLLIAARAETVLALRTHLHERHGVHAAVFHEGMEIVERDRAAAYFADPEEGTRLLLCSEIGSEGRNFQFAHHLVLFDLPLDPELLEQRIGRLDRIGQTRDVEIHVPYIAGTGMETLYRWYADGLDAFARHCPAAPAVYEQLGARLHAALAGDAADGESVNDLLRDAAALRERLNAELSAGRDRLLELSSHRPDVSADLVQAMEAADRDPALFEYLSAFWDAFGVDQEPGLGGSVVLHPGRHMLQEHFPGLPEDGLTVTFDRNHALAHEDRSFLSWEHPLTLAAMDQLTGSDLGGAALILTRSPGFRAGALLLEMLYVAECPAPPALRVQRFLPRLGLRLLLDEHGGDHAAAIATDALTGKCLTGNRKLASALITAKTPAIERMLAAGEARADAAVSTMREAAVARMEAMLDAEIERLSALARVNPAVRTDEIDQLRHRRERLGQVLRRAHLRLDAVRLVAHA